MVAIGEVGNVANALKFFVVNTVFDFVNDPLWADKIGQLCDNKACFPGPDWFHTHGGAHFETTSPRRIGFLDSLKSDDGAPGGKVWARNEAHQIFQGCLRMINQVSGGLDNLERVVGSHISGHAHRDSAGTINQQVGEPGGQNTGLSELVVVIGNKIHDVFIEVSNHRHGRGGQSRFGVPCSGWAVIKRPKVSMTINHGHAHAKRLGESHQGVIDGAISVGMELTNHVAHDSG